MSLQRLGARAVYENPANTGCALFQMLSADEAGSAGLANAECQTKIPWTFPLASSQYLTFYTRPAPPRPAPLSPTPLTARIDARILLSSSAEYGNDRPMIDETDFISQGIPASTDLQTPNATSTGMAHDNCLQISKRLYETSFNSRVKRHSMPETSHQGKKDLGRAPPGIEATRRLLPQAAERRDVGPCAGADRMTERITIPGAESIATRGELGRVRRPGTTSAHIGGMSSNRSVMLGDRVGAAGSVRVEERRGEERRGEERRGEQSRCEQRNGQASTGRPPKRLHREKSPGKHAKVRQRPCDWLYGPCRRRRATPAAVRSLMVGLRYGAKPVGRSVASSVICLPTSPYTHAILATKLVLQSGNSAALDNHPNILASSNVGDAGRR
ncbi:unnamed protein product [Diplocarpon coronariae]|nr:hypothetical protein JHW43_004188 [Diplocarpon mali]